MSITKSIGKNTLGGGKGMEVRMHEYHRSTHNLSYAWRSTMTVGTLVPFMKQVALPGDTWEIQLDTKCFTHPTVGPLFGSYKLQLDVFTCPMRLYIAPLHNNALNVGLDMSVIKIPQLSKNEGLGDKPEKNDPNPWKNINPSSILRYLGMQQNWDTKNALPLLSYLDIFKNYYANKQEENFYAIMSDEAKPKTSGNYESKAGTPPTLTGSMTVTYVDTDDNLDNYFLVTKNNGKLKYWRASDDAAFGIQRGTGNFTANIGANNYVSGVYTGWVYNKGINLKAYELSTLDDLREYLLKQGFNQVTFSTSEGGGTQYIPDILNKTTNNIAQSSLPLSGLLIKTYQSDLYNNWIQTEWIDGENGINAITAIDTSSGSFSMDSLNLAKKVYDMLNRIAISGGTYKDWIDTVYTTGYELHAETPIYEGGMSEEIEFQEVVSNSATEEEPLGTLAGRGINNRNSRKGGTLKIKVKEPSYIMGIVSITPRVDYAEGEDWDITELKTIDDLHKPALDGIGFQDLLTRTFAGWTDKNVSIGKQPAWINYMTNVNRVYGNFAIEDNEMFMTLVKRVEYTYEGNELNPAKLKWSSYIEPELYNYIFADTSLDAQNFWLQIGVGAKVRRVMSAKQIPNL